MGQLTVYGGSFLPGEASFSLGLLNLKTEEKRWVGEVVPLGNIQSVKKLNKEERVQRLRILGSGIAGGALFGPVGALLGMSLIDKKEVVSFEAFLVDGRSLIASCDMIDYQRFFLAKEVV